ncbi:fatty acid synthase-like protein 2 [Leptotrombidium deliense]|uniref:Fatty acid synthase-like protein 2 n=1 Tax=Leptotrombidium deliense TaxID=299467 RepID=A0A443RT60_9ACAR|nr:fatty acid synthase-like protein 2 [Leptotrombidium deliense]
MKKCSSSSENKKNENKLSFNKSYLELATEVFTRLNDVEKGIPIFFFPPSEGNFSLMSTLTPFMNNRPIIGVNWTSEINELNTVKDIAAKYVHLIREQYN